MTSAGQSGESFVVQLASGITDTPASTYAAGVGIPAQALPFSYTGSLLFS